MVPRNRTREFSKVSFIFSAKDVESRISSPIAMVICRAGSGFAYSDRYMQKREKEFEVTYVFEHLDSRAHAFHLLVVLRLEL